MLKVLSNSDKTSLKTFSRTRNEAYEVLMFWSIYGFFVVWEQYFEKMIRWFPLYYYMKSFFILLMAVPKLKLTNLVFCDVLVPLVDNFYKLLIGDGDKLPGALEMIWSSLILFLSLIFPILEEDQRRETISNEGVSTLDTPHMNLIQTDTTLSSGDMMDRAINEDGQLILLESKLAENSYGSAAPVKAPVSVVELLDHEPSIESLDGQLPETDTETVAESEVNSIEGSLLAIQSCDFQTASPAVLFEESDVETSLRKLLISSRRLSELAASCRASAAAATNQIEGTCYHHSTDEHSHRASPGKATTTTKEGTVESEPHLSPDKSSTPSNTDKKGLRSSLVRGMRSIIAGSSSSSLRSTLDLHSPSANTQHRMRLSKLAEASPPSPPSYAKTVPLTAVADKPMRPQPSILDKKEASRRQSRCNARPLNGPVDRREDQTATESPPVLTRSTSRAKKLKAGLTGMFHK